VFGPKGERGVLEFDLVSREPRTFEVQARGSDFDFSFGSSSTT
jgi:hypothetical protein